MEGAARELSLSDSTRMTVRSSSPRQFALFACLLVTLSSMPLRAEETAANFFQGLRERRLFNLAESYCLQRLSRPNLPADQRIDLTLELAATQSEHAKFVAEAEATEFWNKARAEIEELLARDPGNPRRILLEAEVAFISVTEGEWARWQADLMPYDETYRSQARTVLSAAVINLRELEQRIAAQARKAAPARTGARRELRPFEVRALLLEVRYRLAAALLNQAAIADVPNRTDGLHEAEKLLRALTESLGGEDITWGSWVMLAECYRLLGDGIHALAVLKAIETRKPAPEVIDRVTAERVRLLLIEQQDLGAQKVISEYAKTRQPLPGELALLHVQVLGRLVRALRAKQADAAATELLGLIETQVEQVVRDTGGYWSYRCALVMDQLRDEQKYGVEVAPLVRRAQAEYTRRRLAAAVESYGRAAAEARRTGKEELAFTLAFQRASILTQEKKWDDAASSFRELVQKFPGNPKAVDADLLAAFALGKLYEDKQTKARREQYIEALEAHRKAYAGHPSEAEATWMLAQLEERREQFTVALKLYRQIPNGHARGPAAQIGMARCYDKILHRLRELGEPAGPWEGEAIAALESMLPLPSIGTSHFDLQQSEIAVRLARILLQRQPANFTAADRLLARVFAGLAAIPPAEEAKPGENDERVGLQTQATQLRVVSLAGQGKAQDARKLLDQLSATSPSELLRILNGIARIVAAAQPQSRRDLGELQFEAAQKLARRRSELTPVEQRRLDECLASAYMATGQSKLAIQTYEALMKSAPRDKALLTAYAEVLSRCDTQPCRDKAHTTWKTIESLSPAGSNEWLAARLHVCQALLDLGDAPAALKLLKVTRLLYPKLGGDTLRAKFGELEARCAKP